MCVYLSAICNSGSVCKCKLILFVRTCLCMYMGTKATCMLNREIAIGDSELTLIYA